MNQTKAIEVLAAMQIWRRGDGDEMPYSPKEFGEAIDVAIADMKAKRQMTVHELKILPRFFKAIKDGRKKFEVRKDDRDFRRGDILRLREYFDGEYTGLEVYCLVLYVLHANDFEGLADGYCVMSIELLNMTK